MLRNDDIYACISTSYDLLVSKEDYLHNIPGTLVELAEGDFFGNELGDRIREQQTRIIPECTGVWWRTT